MNYSSKHAELEIFQERITSQIGRDNFSTLATPVTDIVSANRKVRHADSLVLALNPAITDTTAQLSYLNALTNRQKDTCEAYWYHPDHLGSSSWITYSNGSAVQHLHYLPWGEDFVDQRTTSWNAMFTFSAKERDSETGYSYFGSRYYSSDLSIWLSVDPMSGKYPSLSPYVYCADNPIKLVDPDGEEWYVNEDGYIKSGENTDDHNVYFVKGKTKDNFDDYQRDSEGNKIAVDIGEDISQQRTLLSGLFRDVDEKIKPYTSEYFEISDLQKARELFTCMSKYTDNEWSFWGDDAGYHLSTSRIKHTDVYGGYAALSAGEQGKLTFFFHSHPRNELQGMFVNDRDRATRNNCLKGSPSAIIGVMHNGTLYDFKIFKIDWDGNRK